jgi:hypothetical protein
MNSPSAEKQTAIIFALIKGCSIHTVKRQRRGTVGYEEGWQHDAILDGKRKDGLQGFTVQSLSQWPFETHPRIICGGAPQGEGKVKGETINRLRLRS